MSPEATVGDREQMEVSLTAGSTGAERAGMENLVGNVFMTMLIAARQGSVEVARNGTTRGRLAKGV